LNKTIRSTCGLCWQGCGVLIHMEDGKPVRVEGDPDSPVNRGKLCMRGQASLEYLYHPDRLKSPLKREGERGEGKWKPISWDEALTIMADRLAKIKDAYGAESLALTKGAAKGVQDSWLARFANVFGTPNICDQGQICDVPRSRAWGVTAGYRAAYPDYTYPPSCLIIWGLNPVETYHYYYRQILEAIDKGTKLIVIDPREVDLAKRADQWLRVRPGTDLALALGIIHVIINEGLFDTTFVDEWTVGFDELKTHVQDYSPQKVQEITWVDAEAIIEAARMYANNRPGCIAWGNAIDSNLNNFQTARAVCILRAITGNLEIPGGELQRLQAVKGGRSSAPLEIRDMMPEHIFKKRVGDDLGLVPTFRDIIPQSIVKSILEGDPYPIKAIYVQGVNPLLTWSNAQETYSAFMKLDFLAVAERFMTPTAAIADLVLPSTSYLEYDSAFFNLDNSVVSVQQKVAQVGECRSDYDILSAVSRKLGLGQYWCENEEQCLDDVLKPVGITFDELRKIGVIVGATQYRSYEKNGFKTPSGKVELYSSQMKEWGLDPLPIYYECPETPYSEPELAKEYPLVFTDWKLTQYRHSSGKQIASLRNSHPDPLVRIHPETAGKLGINEGDWVYIETKRGRIKQKATLTTTFDPRVVGVEYGWWYPEKGASELYGWAESNINVLTDNKPPFSREMGGSNFRGVLCRVYKVA
jgi:anaerobic selenocysteine-containing dehydrogenase